MGIRSTEALGLGSSNQKNSADPKMILTYSCPRGWTTAWHGRSCLLPSPETRVSPVSVDGQWGGGPDLSQPPKMAGSYRPSPEPHPPHMTQNRTVCPDPPPPVVSEAATLALNSPLLTVFIRYLPLGCRQWFPPPTPAPPG